MTLSFVIDIKPQAALELSDHSFAWANQGKDLRKFENGLNLFADRRLDIVYYVGSKYVIVLVDINIIY